jgi:hypothetical protein
MQPGPAPSGGNASGPAPGYWLEFAPGEADPERGHVFCGTHAQPSARCPNCDAPLLRYAALDARDARLPLRLALDGCLPSCRSSSTPVRAAPQSAQSRRAIERRSRRRAPPSARSVPQPRCAVGRVSSAPNAWRSAHSR